MSVGLHVLVLAAGASTRLGQPKQLVNLGGRPALHIVLAKAVSVAGSAVTVVLGAHASDLTYLFTHSPASMVVNREWQEGLGSSLRCGVAALPPGCEAAMVVLADQVAVTADDLKRLAAAWRGDVTRVAASVYDHHVGVPAIFPYWCFAELMELRGDRGARSILERYRERLTRVAMPNAAVDLDTPEDLAALTARFNAGEASRQSE